MYGLLYGTLHCYCRVRERKKIQAFLPFYICLKNRIHSLPLQGEKNEFCKAKVPGLRGRWALWCPPESTPDPLQGTPSEVTLGREEMPACLPHQGPPIPYSWVELGGERRLAHQTLQKK